MNFARNKWSIQIQSKTSSKSPLGVLQDTWTTFATEFAEVIPTGGKEYTKEGRQWMSSPAIFNIRYRTDVTQNNRIVYNNQVFDITSVNMIKWRDGLSINAESTNNSNTGSGFSQ